MSKIQNPWVKLLIMLVGVPLIFYLFMLGMVASMGGGSSEIFYLFFAFGIIFVIYKAIRYKK